MAQRTTQPPKLKTHQVRPEVLEEGDLLVQRGGVVGQGEGAPASCCCGGGGCRGPVVFVGLGGLCGFERGGGRSGWWVSRLYDRGLSFEITVYTWVG